MVLHDDGALSVCSHGGRTFCIDPAAEINRRSAASGVVHFARSWC